LDAHQSLDILIIQRIQKETLKSEKDYTGGPSKPILRIAQRHMTESTVKQTSTIVEDGKSSSKHVRRIPLAWPLIDDEMKAAALSALDEKLVMGESVFKFEEEFARYCGTKYAVSTSSGTTALSISLQALGIGQGAEAVTTPFSFIATANAVLHAGADPVFADVENDGTNLDPAKAKAVIGPKTRAIIPVHLYGQPARMDEFLAMSRDKDVKVIEDACQAHGAEVAGRKAGSLGDAGCFSFYPAKNMTVGGDGGIITTNDRDLAEAAMSIRDCGRDKNSKYHMGRVGYTARLNTVNAAIGRVQLKRLDAWNEARRRLVRRYRNELKGVEGIKLPSEGRTRDKGVYHLFVIRTKHREQVKKHLENVGIESGVHYPVPIHLQLPYRQKYGFSEGAFPLSESLSDEVLSLPLYPTLSENEVVTVSDAVKASLKH
jgi:perosamine synthetase